MYIQKGIHTLRDVIYMYYMCMYLVYIIIHVANSHYVHVHCTCTQPHRLYSTHCEDGIHRLCNVEGMPPVMVGDWTIVLLHSQHPLMQNLDTERILHTSKLLIHTCTVHVYMYNIHVCVRI